MCEKQLKIIEHLQHQKILCVCVCMYKWSILAKKQQHENSDIEVIVDCNGTLLLNEKHVKEKLGHENYMMGLIWKNKQY